MTVNVPLGIRMLPEIPGINRTLTYKLFIIILTFLCYMSYHLSRKPISVVKSELHRNCSSLAGAPNHPNDSVWCDWAPFDKNNYSSLFGALDLAYLFSYAVGMFFTGHTAERMNLRYFLTLGMLSSGIMTAAFGFGYFFDIHSIAFYMIVQSVGGFVQSSGWPSVVTCMGNWYGKGKRGLIMGIWNSHTSVGNILGSIIAGAFVNYAWGWSFVVPGIIIGSLGIVVFFFLVPHPMDAHCDLPDHHGEISSYGENKDYGSKDKETSDLSDYDDLFLNKEPLLNSENSLHSLNRTIEYGTSHPSQASLISHKQQEKPITLWGALKIPGVIEFSLCLFFSKLVSYTFLFWLPKYISAKTSYDSEKSADISTFFDVGGIIGGIGTGMFSDYTGMSATACVIMLVISAPVLYIYNLYGSLSLAHSIGLSILCGAFVNGPYALITTAVSADLGTHKILKGNSKALSTVTAIIDGTGSIGAALGPMLAGLIESSGWNNVFYMLIGADVIAMLLLIRLMVKEIRSKKLCS